MRMLYLLLVYGAAHDDYRIGYSTILGLYLLGCWLIILLPQPWSWAGPMVMGLAGWLLGGRWFRHWK